MQHLQPNTTLQGGKYRIVLTKCLTHCEYDYMPDMPDYMSDYMENPEFLDHIDNEKSDEKL